MTWDILGKSGRGERPTQQGDGTTEQEKYRTAFQQCTVLWNSLPEACPVVEPDPPTSSKESVWAAKLEHGVVCSYYDLFLRCCIKFALANDGAMPTDECFPCEYECSCVGISIGFTSLSMEVGSFQDLTVIGAKEECSYKWAIVSGGGSLSAATGATVRYTAPATNPDCLSNAVISLSVGEDTCDSLGIAIYAVGNPSVVAYWLVDDFITTVCRAVGENRYYCSRSVSVKSYNCAGVYLADVQSFGGSTSPWDTHTCKECLAYLGSKGCTEADVWEQVAAAGFSSGEVIDKRTEAMKAAGCCPAELQEV